MKQIYMIFAVSISFAGLSAMSEEKDYQKTVAESLNFRPLFDAPYIAKWQKIGKDPQERKKLVNVYQGFCIERFTYSIPWLGSWIPACGLSIYALGDGFNRRIIRRQSSYGVAVLAYFFAARQTYLLARNHYRAELANRGDLYYLNNDIWEQLGHPEVAKRYIYPKNHWYWIGDPHRETKYRINTVSDIERALSGKHPERVYQT